MEAENRAAAAADAHALPSAAVSKLLASSTGRAPVRAQEPTASDPAGDTRASGDARERPANDGPGGTAAARESPATSGEPAAPGA